MVDGAEERRPVDGVIVAQVAVVSNIDVSCTDFLQGLELQGSDALLLEDKQGEATKERGEGTWNNNKYFMAGTFISKVKYQVSHLTPKEDKQTTDRD